MEQGTKVAIELLAKGLSTTDVAGILDVTPSAVSQVATNYTQQIEDKKTDVKLMAASNSARLDKLETTLLGKLEKAISYETDLTKLVGTFRVLNAAHRRDLGNPQMDDSTGTAELKLSPTFIQNNISFIQNNNGEIIEAGGRPLTTASIDHVEKLAKLDITEITEKPKSIKSNKSLEVLNEEVSADDFG